MPSPFPGMDPYLEQAKLWPAFHHHMVASLYSLLLPNLVDRYRARVAARSYATEEPLFTSVVREERREEFIEVRQKSDNRLVTLIDVVSPVNKTLTQGREAYHATRREGRSAKANLVEIDLVTQGKPLLDYSRDGLPEWDYAVTVTRSTQPDRFEIYTTTLQKRLPRFKLPMAADDRDTLLDLQSAFGRAYDQGDFGRCVDYAHDPTVSLDDADKKWVADLLKQHKLR